eukprot:Phypoly_transcript_06470.p1 GENE.Phypoly_transcript_06470~~Phypoly_transcript_06470.p1  ORF type:complete len:577 (+),score=57.82 Phypoly_transcript_06470:197-1732(+)
MEAGVTYRTQICENATRCDVFIAFINHGWCKSTECEFEFNIALSSSLKSPNRTPYIIPILLEEFSFYESYPTVNGFLKNAMGIPTKHTELGVPMWAKVLRTITTHRQLTPHNPPSPVPIHQASRPTPTAAPAQPAINKRAPVARGLPTRDVPANVAPSVAQAPPSPELIALVETAKQLIEDISAYRVEPNLLAQLQGIVKTTLQNLKPSVQLETALRALMDYLSKIKEISAALQFTQTGQFTDARKAQDRVVKLAQILHNPNNNFSVQEFIDEAETRQFWERHFGKAAYTTPWATFVTALTSEANYKVVRGDPEVEAMLQDLHMYLDHYNTGHVVCHRLSDFVGQEPLSVALLKYTKKPLQAQSPAPLRAGSSDIAYPLILWIDDFPENNEDMVQYARGNGVTVIPLQSTIAAKQWILEHPKVLERCNAEAKNKVRIITDNVRNGANTVLDLNAGEDIIRYVRSRRSNVPVLVYCGDLNYARYVAKYKDCSSANEASTCQEFIEALFPGRT